MFEYRFDHSLHNLIALKLLIKEKSSTVRRLTLLKPFIPFLPYDTKFHIVLVRQHVLLCLELYLPFWLKKKKHQINILYLYILKVLNYIEVTIVTSINFLMKKRRKYNNVKIISSIIVVKK